MRPPMDRSRSELAVASARRFRNVVVKSSSQKSKTQKSSRRGMASTETRSITASNIKPAPSKIPRFSTTSSLHRRGSRTRALSTLGKIPARTQPEDQATASTTGNTSSGSISSRSYNFLESNSDDEISLQSSVRQVALAMKAGKSLSLELEDTNEDTVMASNTKTSSVESVGERGTNAVEEPLQITTSPVSLST